MKILISDDHAIVRKGLIQIMNESPIISQIDEAEDGQQTLEIVSANKYDIIILDLAMPGIDGMKLLEIIKTNNPDQRVLILSMYDEEIYAVRVLKAGADGYLRKTSAPEELINALELISNGRKYISANVAEQMAHELSKPQNKLPHERLSQREFQILVKIADGKKLSEIAEEMLLSRKTISTYRTRLLEKMNMTNNSELIRYVLENNISGE